MSNPLLSIIISCHNQAPYIKEAIQSVKAQTYTNWECIIINDGSTDESEAIIQQQINGDTRFVYMYQSNKGVSTARNEGIKLSKGKYILPLDGDDLLEHHYANDAIGVLELNGDVGLVYAQANLFGIKEGLWNVPSFEWKSFLLDNCIFCSALFSREDYNKTAGYDDNLIHGLEDWEFWIQLLSFTKKKVYKLNQVGLHYRVKETSRNSSLKSSENNMLQSLEYIHAKHHHLYKEIWGNPILLLRDYERIKADNNRYINLLNTTVVKKLMAIRKWLTGN